MIILEGCDAAGKTTVLMHLAQKFKLAINRSYYRATQAHEIVDYHNWIRSCPQRLILDRHPAISDLVYGPILRGYTPSTMRFARSVNNTSFVIFCSPPLQTIQANLHNEEQLEGVDKNLLAIYHAYEDLMETLAPSFTYDYTDRSQLPLLEERVSDYLRSTR